MTVRIQRMDPGRVDGVKAASERTGKQSTIGLWPWKGDKGHERWWKSQRPGGMTRHGGLLESRQMTLVDVSKFWRQKK